MPNSTSDDGALKEVAVHGSPLAVVSTLKTSGFVASPLWSTYKTYAVALRSTPIENGSYIKGSPNCGSVVGTGHVSVPRSWNIFVVGSNCERVLFESTT